MIADKSVLAVIPARGGSKGVPRKNVRELNGKPLIAWSIEEGRKSRLIDRLIVSSEDAEILQVARRCGCETPFVRPAELAADETPGMDPVRHALAQVPGYDYIVLLQPTSPLRLAADIDQAIRTCHSASADACVSMTAVHVPPQWMYVRNAAGLIEPLLNDLEMSARRQDLPAMLGLNGAVYVSRSEWIAAGHSFLEGRVVAYEMPPERSLDIDTEWDWHVVARIIDGPRFVR